MSLFGKSQRDDGPRAGEAPAPAAPVPAPGDAAAPHSQTRGAQRSFEGGNVANIGKSITIKGDLSGDEDLVIEGRVEGKVQLPNNELTVGANGKVKADLEAKAVIVIGHVTGNVSGTERVEIQASGIIDGDVSAPRLVVQEGAVLNGAVDMSGSKGAARPASAPPSPAPPKAAAGGQG